MPCDSGMSSGDYYREGLESGKKRLDAVTDMLCRVLRHLPDEVQHLDADIQAWWKEHQKYDEKSGR